MEEAFGRPVAEVAGAWREHLERLATPGAGRVAGRLDRRPARFRGTPATTGYMERLTRRQLIARGGGVAGAAALGSLALAREANRSGPHPAAPPEGPARPLKGIALGGFGPLRSAHDPNDYLEWGNREYVRASRTDVIRLQVSWRYLQPLAPASRGESWDQLTRDHGEGALRRLDRQIAAANRDGVRVILGLYHSYPEWSNGTTPGTVEPITGKPPDAKFPLDLSPDGAVGLVRLVSVRPLRWAVPAPHLGTRDLQRAEPPVLAPTGGGRRGRGDGDRGGAGGGRPARIPRS